MGYRTTFVTEDIDLPLPEWFVDKWKSSVHFGKGYGNEPNLPLSSKWERKFYDGAKDELFIDIARLIREDERSWLNSLEIVMMHEDGLIDKVFVYSNKIVLARSFQHDLGPGYNPQLNSYDETYEIPTELPTPTDQKEKE